MTPERLRAVIAQHAGGLLERAELVNAIRGVATTTHPFVDEFGLGGGVLSRSLDRLIIREHDTDIDDPLDVARSLITGFATEVGFGLVRDFPNETIRDLSIHLERAITTPTASNLAREREDAALAVEVVAVERRSYLATADRTPTGEGIPAGEGMPAVETSTPDDPPRALWYRTALGVTTIVHALLELAAGAVDGDQPGVAATGNPDTMAAAFFESLDGRSSWFTSDPQGPFWALRERKELTPWFYELIDGRVETPHGGWITARMNRFDGGSNPELAQPRGSADVDVALEGIDGPIRLRFSDDSRLALPLGDELPPDSTSAPTPTIGPGSTGDVLLEPVRVRPFEMVDTLTTPDQIATTRDAIEQMIGDLTAFLERPDIDMPARETAEALRDHLIRLARMESPPPVASVDGTMTAAAQLLHTSTEPSESPELDAAIDRLLAPRPPGDATGLAEPLGDVLGEAAKEKKRAGRLRHETSEGAWVGYRLLVTGVVVAAASAAVEGIGWLAGNRSWLAAFIKWILGAAQ